MTTDPFATQEKTPAVSFKDKPIGTSYTGKVVEAPQIVQARDYETGEPDYWDKEKTQPKKAVVTILEINGERLGLWCLWKYSSMFRAIQEAQEKAGAQLAVGGILTVTFIGEQPNEKNPRLNPTKLFSASYQPNDPFAEPHVNMQTGEVTNQQGVASGFAASQGPQPEWSLPQSAPVVSTATGQPVVHQQSVPQAQPKQHSAETIAALRAAGLDPAKVPVL